MKTLLLSRGIITQVDDDVFNWASQFKWWATSGKNIYAVRQGYGDDPTTVYLHKAILSPPVGYHVDHINRNTLCNVRSNLRICTSQQNLWNVPGKGGKSRYKGVHFVLRKTSLSKPWMVRIRTEAERKFVGYFSTEEEAAVAYDLFAIKEHGEFACLNFPELKEKY